MNFNDLPKHVQERIKRDNPGLFDSVRPRQSAAAKPNSAKALERSHEVQPPSQSKLAFCISLIVLSRRKMDSDSVVGACKWHRDAIAESLGLDDGDERITWEYGHSFTRGQEGVLVKIELCL